MASACRAEDGLGARESRRGLRQASEIDVDRAEMRQDLGHRGLVRSAFALFRGERLFEQARRGREIAETPGDGAERVLQSRLDQRLVGELAGDPLAAEVDDLAHRDLAPLRALRIGLLEEVDEKVDDAIRRRRLAVGAGHLAFELHREVLGAGAGTLLAQREVGDHGEDDGQQGERDRERDDLQSPAPQAMRFVEQVTQPVEALLGRRSSRRNGVLQVLHQPSDLGIDAVGREERQAAVLGDAHEELRQRFARVGRSPGQQFLQQDGEREHVARLGQLLARGLFRAHVEDGSDDRSLLRERGRKGRSAVLAAGERDRALGVGRRRRCELRGRARRGAVLCAAGLFGARAGDTEVEHLHGSRGEHHDVRRLEIAMNDVLAMRHGQRLGDSGADFENFALGELAVGAQLIQGLAVDELEHQEIGLIRLDEVVDLADERIGEPRENPRLAQETGAGGAGEAVLGADRLHRHDPLQLLVEGAVDLAHASHAEEALEANVADGRADQAHSDQPETKPSHAPSPSSAVTESRKTAVWRSTSSSVVAGDMRAMLWNGVMRMPRFRDARCM